MRFLHLADVHLGNQQYGLSERFNDFAQAFQQAIDYGLQENVDAILIAGDLFHKAAVEPMAFMQAVDILKPARARGLPVIVVEGNHDQARYRDQVSWLDVLAMEDYIQLLRAELPEDAPCRLAPWNPQQRMGSYVDIGSLRVIGLQWLGAAAANMMADFSCAVQQLPNDGIDFTVVLTHAALEGEMAHLSTYLTHTQLGELEQEVQYLALGHLHKPFIERDWIYNPGSLEVFDVSEIQYAKGWLDVEVLPDGQKRVRKIACLHRPFFVEEFSVSGYTNPAALYRDCLDHIRAQAEARRGQPTLPVVHVRLEGELGFDRYEIDWNWLEQGIKEAANALHVVIDQGRLRMPGVDVTVDETLSHAELELSVLRQIAEGDSRFAEKSDRWARAMLDIKKLALEERPEMEILNALQAHIDQIEEAGHVD